MATSGKYTGGVENARDRWKYAALLVFGLGTSVASPAAVSEAPTKFVEFVEQPDSRCQILSSGGQLRLVKNNHPQRRIKLRLQRYLAQTKQAGLVVTELDAGGVLSRLGCSRVDGKEQRWDLQRAEFIE